MKLTRLDLYQIVIPRPRFVTAFTTYTESRNAFVRAWTDSGLCGVGETVAVPSYLGDTYEAMQGAFKILAPALLGRDPWEIGATHDLMDDLIIGHKPSKAAIDTALHDLMGQAAGVPVYALLGGATPSRRIWPSPSWSPKKWRRGPSNSSRTAFAPSR